jgi:hypothetical protein
MKRLKQFERKLQPLAFANVTVYLVAFQALTAILAATHPNYLGKLVLDHEQLFEGEWWRLFTMIVMPPAQNLIWVAFDLYFFYLMGTALEQHWGALRYNLYLLIGYLCTLLAALIPGAVVTNLYWLGSVMLAFAWLYPDFTVLLFLILPTKMKWLGLLTWIIFLGVLVTGDWAQRAEVGGGIVSFLIFFGGDVIQSIGAHYRKSNNQMAKTRAQEEPSVTPVHVCTTCGVSLKTDPHMEFRYCPQCTGTPCYCIHHINNHVHR